MQEYPYNAYTNTYSSMPNDGQKPWFPHIHVHPDRYPCKRMDIHVDVHVSLEKGFYFTFHNQNT